MENLSAELQFPKPASSILSTGPPYDDHAVRCSKEKGLRSSFVLRRPFLTVAPENQL